MSECWIGIGANLGDSRASFDAALHELARVPGIQLLARSGLYRTAPIGQQAGGIFWNAVFSLETVLAPIELLDRLQSIESALGRTRELRWGPRRLDLDLLFFGEQIIESSRLTVPHPAAWYRRFVIDPLVEVASSLRHPLFKQTIGELHIELTQRPLIVSSFDHEIISRASELTDRFPGVQLLPATATAVDERGYLLKLKADDWTEPCWHGKPVADLTASPGDPFQRVTDFLASALDSPGRVSDW